MQVLWSRAAPTRSCHCSSCLQAATTIARRTTTAASRRQLKFGDLFTACYSTILATAAVADAKVKEERRREWDRLIAEAKGLPIEKKEEAHEPENAKERTRNPTPAVWDGTCWTTAAPVKDARWTKQLKILDSHLKQSLAEPAKRLWKQSAAVEEDWDDDDDPEGILLPREPKNQLQVYMMEHNIAKLVARLLLHSKVKSATRSSTATAGRLQFSAQMEEMTRRIEALQRGDTRLPLYSFHDPASVKKERAELHNSLVALYSRTSVNGSNIDVMIAKICYNLLVSTAPPNITTYNILIDCFTRLKEYELGDLVVESFLLESRYKPNPATIRLILHHFAEKGDSIGFRRIVRRMRGVDQDMRVKRRALSNLQLSEVQSWALKNKVVHRNGQLVQKMPRNATIFDSLIQGCLTLTDVRSAIRYFRAALREGYEVKSRTLFQIVEACLQQLDYIAGHSLLYAILLQWERGSLPGHGIRYNSLVRHAIYQLLGLCRVSIDSTRKLPVKASRDSLQRMLRHMKIEAIADASDRFAERISFVENLILHTQHPEDDGITTSGETVQLVGSEIPVEGPENSYQRLNLAVRILNDAPLREQLHEDRIKGNSARARLRTLQVFKSILFAKSKDIIFMQQELLPISYNHLSPQSKLKYDAATREREDIPISERLDLLFRLHREANQEKSVVGSQVLEMQCVEQPAPRLEIQTRNFPQPIRPPTPPTGVPFSGFRTVLLDPRLQDEAIVARE